MCFFKNVFFLFLSFCFLLKQVTQIKSSSSTWSLELEFFPWFCWWWWFWSRTWSRSASPRTSSWRPPPNLSTLPQKHPWYSVTYRQPLTSSSFLICFSTFFFLPFSHQFLISQDEAPYSPDLNAVPEDHVGGHQPSNLPDCVPLEINSEYIWYQHGRVCPGSNTLLLIVMTSFHSNHTHSLLLPSPPPHSLWTHLHGSGSGFCAASETAGAFARSEGYGNRTSRDGLPPLPRG